MAFNDQRRLLRKARHQPDQCEMNSPQLQLDALRLSAMISQYFVASTISRVSGRGITEIPLTLLRRLDTHYKRHRGANENTVHNPFCDARKNRCDRNAKNYGHESREGITTDLRNLSIIIFSLVPALWTVILQFSVKKQIPIIQAERVSQHIKSIFGN